MPRRYWLLFGLLAIVGVGIRLYHLTDPPLAFHPTRQMHSALISRQLYLTWRPGITTPAEAEQRFLGNRMARYEPPLFEALVAKTCLLAGKHFGFHLWVARLYDALFWLLGALGVFLLARRLTDGFSALLATAYWWLLPFAIYASRSFQPDPLMTVLLVWTAWASLTWAENTAAHPRRDLALLLLATGLGASTGVVKVYGIIFAAGIFTAAAWLRYRTAWWRKAAFWGGLAGMAVPVLAVYGLIMPRHGAEAEFLQVWVIRMSRQLLSPKIYGGWLQQLNEAFGGGFLLLALLGAVLGNARTRVLALGWGVAYGVYGLLVPFHLATHSYYQLPLLPLVSIGLAAAVYALKPLTRAAPRLGKAALAVGLLAAVVYPVGITAWQMATCPCRQEAQTYIELGERLPEGKIVALTPAYGYPLMYYSNRTVDFWPTSRYQQVFDYSPEAFARLFSQRAGGHDYFLITDLAEFARQQALRHYLSTHYPIVMEGEGFILFDLRHPLKEQS